ncbi:MAG: DUF3341 domain-containing protein [Bryobacteraceae bacterium]|nr:DUF3341 domain-containing protein [Bryobacteraceae bacterium]
MARFDSPSALRHAAQRLAEEGYRRMDAFSPIPIHGLAEALGMKRTWVPQIVLLGGILGFLGGFALLYYITVLHYPQNVGGRPLFSWPSYIPILFETTVLTAALFGVFGMLFGLNRFPQPYHPVSNAPGFDRASQDAFFLLVEASDPRFERSRTRELLDSLHPAEVHDVEA